MIKEDIQALQIFAKYNSDAELRTPRGAAIGVYKVKKEAIFDVEDLKILASLGWYWNNLYNSWEKCHK